MPEPVSVQPDWCRHLPVQQQSVLLLAARGPDGMRKHHPAKAIIRAYRTLVLNAAVLKRTLTYEDQGDSFMDAAIMRPDPTKSLSVSEVWDTHVTEYLSAVDEIPHHYHLHLMHGAEIIGYKHPEVHMRRLWLDFYRRAADDMHLPIESERDMDDRLDDFGGSPGGSQLEEKRYVALTARQVYRP